MGKTIILLSGKKNTGKDTAGHIIKKMFKCKPCRGKGTRRMAPSECQNCLGDGSRVQLMSFADPLKKFCINVLGLTHQQCYGQSGERETLSPIKWADVNLKYSKPHADKWMETGKWDNYMTARDILQIVGTDVLRNFYQNIWANAACISAVDSPRDIVVFTDTRFPNEITEFQKRADAEEFTLVVIRLRRDGLPEDAHPSEMALNKWDEDGLWQHIIYNNSDIEDLEFNLKRILQDKHGII